MQILINFYGKFPLDVELSTTVEELMKKIEGLNGVKPEFQILTFSGTRMEVGKVLSDYNIKEGSRVDVIPIYPQPENITEFIKFHNNCADWMASILLDNGSLVADVQKWYGKYAFMTSSCVETKFKLKKAQTDLDEALENIRVEKQAGQLIEQMEKLMSTTNKRLNDIEQENINLKTTINDLEGENRDLKKRVFDLENENIKMRKQVQDFKCEDNN